MSPVSAPEAQLLLALARTEISDGDRVDTLIHDGTDWEQLIQLAGEHGVVPLVYHNLKSDFSEAVPSAVLQRLRTIYLVQFRRSIQIRGELPRLLAHLDERGIEPIPFKGPILAALAYRDENLRTFTDLDLLVRLDDVERAIDALTEAGFDEKNPLPPDYDTTWATYSPLDSPHGNANGYVRDKGKPGELHVDLHWGLASRYFLFPMEPEELWTRLTPVTLDNGFTTHTFSPEDTLLFQCMHAAKDAYYQLSHLCDLAELLRQRPSLDIDWVLDKARSVHGERMVLLGLWLSHTLLEAPLPERIRRRARDHHVVPSLARRVKVSLFRHRHGVGRLVQACRFHLRVRDRMRDGLGAVYFNIRTALQPTQEDRDWIDLPSSLAPMYALLRPIRRLVDAVGSDNRSSQPSSSAEDSTANTNETEPLAH